MRVDIDIQRAEDIQLIQAVDGQHYGKLERRLQALLNYAEDWDKEQFKKYSNKGISKRDFRKPTVQLITILIKTQTGHKNVHVSLGQLMRRISLLEKINETRQKDFN